MRRPMIETVTLQAMPRVKASPLLSLLGGVR